LTVSIGLLSVTLLLSLLIQTGLLTQYIAPGYPQLAHDLRIVRRILSHALIWIIVIELLDIKRTKRKLYFLIEGLIYFLLVGAAIASFESLFPMIKSLFGIYIIAMAISSIGMLLIPMYFFINKQDVIRSLFTLNSFCVIVILYMAIRGYVLDQKVNSLWFNDIISYYPFVMSIIFLSAFFYYQWSRTMSDRKLKIELAKAQNRALLNLLEGQKIERRRLSQQLHDGISVLLASVRMRLSAQNQNGDLKPIINDLGIISQDIRNFSHDLSPAILERYGLEKALADLADKVSSGKSRTRINYNGFGSENLNLTPQIEEYLYFILAELINNSLKHGKASYILIHLKNHVEGVQLSYIDNGSGFDAAKITHGLGIKNIESRVDLLKGKNSWSKGENGGLHFQMIIPAYDIFL